MKKLVVMLVFCLALSNLVFSQGMEFFHGSYDELLAEAKKKDKKIFIDFYTKWCGPCKAMAKNVFPQKVVGDFYNRHFINYKVDAEVGEGPMLAKKYKVKGYPTFIYTDHTGQSIYEGSSIGAGEAESFIRLAKLALGLEEKTWEWYQAEYKKGVRNTKFLKGYVVARLAATRMPPDDKLKWEIFNSYPENERFNHENKMMVFWTAKPGNKFYEVLKNNRTEFTHLDTANVVVHWISSIMSFAKWDSTTTVEQTTETLKKDFPKFADQAFEYVAISDLRMSGKTDEYLEQVFGYMEKYGEPMHFGFSCGFAALRAKELKPEHAGYILKFYKEGINDDPPHFFSVSAYAYLLYKSGQKEEAKQFAQKHLELAETFATSKKSKWSYDTVKLIASGAEPASM